MLNLNLFTRTKTSEANSKRRTNNAVIAELNNAIEAAKKEGEVVRSVCLSVCNNKGNLGGLEKVFTIRDRHHRIRRQILRHIGLIYRSIFKYNAAL